MLRERFFRIKHFFSIFVFIVLISIASPTSVEAWSPADYPTYNFLLQTHGAGYEIRDEQLGFIKDISVDEYGNIYVLHSYDILGSDGAREVSIFDSDGNFVRKWGEIGLNLSELSDPISLSASQGKVYVVDSNYVKVFYSFGVFDNAFGGFGAGDSQLMNPSKIEVVGENVLVLESPLHRIKVFDLDGNYQLTIGGEGSGNGEFRWPTGMAFAGNGNLYVFDELNDRVQWFDSSYNYQGQWPVAGPRTSDSDLSVDSEGSVYVSKSSYLRKYSPAGVLLDTFGESGLRSNQISWTYSIENNSSGVLVADSIGKKILVYNLSGEYQKSIGYSAWGGPGQINYVEGIASDSEGNFYIAEGEPDDSTENYRIQKFSATGEFISQFGDWGDEDGYFKWVSGIDLDSEGNIYVSDCEKNIVQKFDNDGNFIRKFTGYDCPMDIEVSGDSSSGLIYVSEPHNDAIVIKRYDGTYLGYFSYSSGHSPLSNPLGLASKGSKLLIADQGNDRIVYALAHQYWGDIDDENIYEIYGNSRSPFNGISDVAFFNNGGDGWMLAVDTDNNRVQFGNLYYASSYIYPYWPIWTFGIAGDSLYQFNNPTKIAVSGDNFLVHDEGNGRLVAFAIDTTEPSVSLNALASEYYRSNFLLSGVASDAASSINAVQYQIGGINGVWKNCYSSDGSFNSKSESFNCLISGFETGENTIYVRASDIRDHVTSGGNIVHTTFVADNVSPTGSIVINDGAGITDSREIELDLTASDDVSGINHMILSENSEFVGSDWQAFSEEVLFRLSEGVEEKTVYVRFVDRAGNQSNIYFAKIMQNSPEIDEVVVKGVTTIPSGESTNQSSDGEEVSNDTTDKPTNDPETVKPSEKPVYEKVVVVNQIVNDRPLAVIERTLADIPISIGDSKAVSGVAITSAFVTASVAFLIGMSSPLLYLMQGAGTFFAFIKLKRGRTNGTTMVYNSFTKEPISGAIVRIYNDKGELVTTEITDIYGLIDTRIDSGRYKIVVGASGYSFPSKTLTSGNDGIYKNVYIGEFFDYDSINPLAVSIPLDSRELSSAKGALIKVRIILEKILSILPVVLIIIGLSFSIVTYVKENNSTNLVIVISYALLIAVYSYVSYMNKDKYGKVIDQDGRPVSGIVLTLTELEYGRVVAQRLTDKNGLYRFILQPGKYKLSVQDSRYKLVDDKVYVVGTGKDRLYINKKLVLSHK